MRNFKRFLVFYALNYYASGGPRDLVAHTDSLATAKYAATHNLHDVNGVEFDSEDDAQWHILDSQSGRLYTKHNDKDEWEQTRVPKLIDLDEALTVEDGVLKASICASMKSKEN